MLLAVVLLIGQLVSSQVAATESDHSQNPINSELGKQSAVARVVNVSNDSNDEGVQGEKNKEDSPNTERVEVMLKSKNKIANGTKTPKVEPEIDPDELAKSIIARDHLQQLAISIAMATGKDSDLMMGL
ncbi:MAG: hypothetical protein LBL32_01475 [Holosporales bacterium]|jgi:hypothetical protein|nr:hypothetical protein [Holosporales bacterium]